MIKHVGKHNDRKVVIVYKTIPDEEHMALVVYPDTLAQLIHDETMKVLESEVGQNAKELADALFRHVMSDGRNCLEAHHKAGYLKKVPTNQVIVTPNAKSGVRLDELNSLLKKLDEGGDAAKRMAEIDAGRGMADPEKTRDLGEPASVNTSTSGVLSDEDIANQRLEQAARMEAEAKSLLAEAKRLKDEANALTPAKVKNVRKTTTTKKDKVQ